MSRLAAAAVRPLVLTCTVAAAALLSAGCMNQQKTEQLSQVAKGWCKTIRASQVIPVYPLTEDVEVGDVFVVQRPIEDEAQLYDEQGFLPLGHHLTRLPATGWERFYAHGAYGVRDGQYPPGLWQFGPEPKPRAVAAADPAAAAQGIPDHHTGSTNWAAAPRAAFPSYSFSIDRSAGLDLGLPIEGVPVALGLLGADHASATVTLADAYSYGLGVDDLLPQLREWVKNNPEATSRYLPRVQYSAARERYEVQYNFLRVVTRAYLIGRTNVSVLDSAQGGGNVSAGLDRSLQLLGMKAGTNADYTKLLDTLNQGLSGNAGAAKAGGGAAPAPAPTPGPTTGDSSAPTFGVKAKFVSVSARSVTMDQAFSRPLVIGYLAVDLPIDWDGSLGARPISTLARVNSGGFIHSTHEVATWARSDPEAPQRLDEWLHEGKPGPDGLTPNQVWLKDNGIDAYQSGAALCKYLQGRGPSQFVNLFWQNKQLNERIIVEVMERPPGLGADKARLEVQEQRLRATTRPAAAAAFPGGAGGDPGR